MKHHEDRERLVEVLNSSTRVLSSSHFFGWTQGPLQSLIPHEILICGMADHADRDLRMRYFTATRYFRPEHFEAACHPQTGLIAQVIEHWKAAPQPCLIPAATVRRNGGDAVERRWHEMLQRLELRNMAAHGQISPHGGLLSWFGFFRVRDLGPHTADVLDMILPWVTATYSRVLYHESGGASSPVTSLGVILSRRERQVLELVRDGRSNQDIADHLRISATTAKNHVQNIRAKLKVKTRGQAVVEAIRLGLIPPIR